MHCRKCGLEQQAGNRFCEDCGASLTATPPPIAIRRDRLEVRAAPHLAGVSDRGRRHSHNEDFLALQCASGAEALVVCDGVSSSQSPGIASAVAAEAACEALAEMLRQEVLLDEAAMIAAVARASAAVAAVHYDADAPGDPPETTFVAAARRGRRLVLGWLGDSRAYLIGPQAARQLTEDHSWINEVVASGVMTVEEAQRAPLAHAVTRTLGGPTGQATDLPSLAVLDLEGDHNTLVLCTDGLWNCYPHAERLADILRRRKSSDALVLATALVDAACVRCGHDNITAAVLLL